MPGGDDRSGVRPIKKVKKRASTVVRAVTSRRLLWGDHGEKLDWLNHYPSRWRINSNT